MAELLKSVDTWFLIFVILLLFGTVTLLGGWFTWSVRNLFHDLKAAINELKTTIQELFDSRNELSARVAILETRMSVCESCNGHGHGHSRQGD